MTGYIGEFNHSIDAKGRMAVPARFRAELGEGFVITKGFDTNLYIYDADGWSAMYEKIASQSVKTKAAREFQTRFFSSASPCEVDKQGRILIPASLRKYAQLDKEAVVVGAGGHIEIWSIDNWNVVDDYDSDDMAAGIEELDI